MYCYSSRQSTMKTKGMQLHSILKDFRKFQREKSVLTNRINVMRNKQSDNQKKKQIIEEHLKSMKRKKQENKRNKQKWSREMSLEKSVKDKERRKRVEEVKEIELRASLSKKMYVHYNEERSSKIRSEHKVNKERIVRNKEENIREKSKSRSRILECQSQSRIKIEAHHHKKLASLRTLQLENLIEQKKVNQVAKMELESLRKLQKDIMLKYSQSMVSLKGSRAKVHKLRA